MTRPSAFASASLKGITSTNDDPNACAVCSGPFPAGAMGDTYAFALCCGKRSCMNCFRAGRLTTCSSGQTTRCSICTTPIPISDKSKIGSLKKRAKRGEAWAQYVLGNCYVNGRHTSRSDHEARRWHEKAAKRGHPWAMHNLGVFYLEGRGGYSIDLTKARHLAKEAMSRDPLWADPCQSLLFEIALRVDDNEAKSILIPLAETGKSSAQNTLGAIIFNNEKNYLHSKQWFEAAALQGNKNAADNILLCCRELQNMPVANFWFNIIVSEPDMMPDEPHQQKNVEKMGRELRKVRDSCGGCGAVLTGDRREYCRQCKTFCYCSRECQKLHWNRVGGHRCECLEVNALKGKIKALCSTTFARSRK